MLRALAAAVLLSYAPLAAGQQVYHSSVPAPEKYSKLQWEYAEKLSNGYWFSEQQVLKIDGRIKYLEEKAAKECVDDQIAVRKSKMPAWVWITAGVIVGGVLGWQATEYVQRTWGSSTATDTAVPVTP